MEEEVLRRIGLTKGEAKVYLALLKLGQSSVGPIIKSSGISSSKVYDILDRLAKKGLLTYVEFENKKKFKITSPKKIFDMLEDRKSGIEKQEAEFSKILPNLLKMEEQRKKPYEAHIYEGYNGIKTYFTDLLAEMKRGGERLVFGARTGYPVSAPAQRFFQSYHKKWVAAGLKTRIIFNSDLCGSSSTRFFEKMKLTEVRYLPQQTLSSVGIQKESIDILIWTKETALLFVIRSREVVDSFRGYFEVLWRTARK